MIRKTPKKWTSEKLKKEKIKGKKKDIKKIVPRPRLEPGTPKIVPPEKKQIMSELLKEAKKEKEILGRFSLDILWSWDIESTYV